MSDKVVELMKKLCTAIKTKNLRAVNECLQGKPPLHLWIDEEDFFTPWHWAHSYGTFQVIEALLDAGADVNTRIPHLNYETVLFGAVTRNESMIVHLLVNRDADVNAVDKDGRTPLHCAIKRSSQKKDMINTLLTLGADITKGKDIIEWMRRDCPEYDEHFYEAYDEFLDEIREDDPELYRLNINRLKKLIQKHKDLLPDYLQEKIDLSEEKEEEEERNSEESDAHSTETHSTETHSTETHSTETHKDFLVDFKREPKFLIRKQEIDSLANISTRSQSPPNEEKMEADQTLSSKIKNLDNNTRLDNEVTD